MSPDTMFWTGMALGVLGYLLGAYMLIKGGRG